MTTITINLELLEKIGKLDAEKQRQVLAYVDSLAPEQEEESSFDFEGWLERVNKLQADLRANYGDDLRVDVQSLLDEVREEPSDKRLRRR